MIKKTNKIFNMKKFILIFFILFITKYNLFSQNNESFLKIMEGKWNIISEESQGFEIWTKINKNNYKVEDYKIFDTDTIKFGIKQIFVEKDMIIKDFGFSEEIDIVNEYILKEVDINYFSFKNQKEEYIISINYLIIDKDKVYFWMEVQDNSFICTDYILKRIN